MKTILLSLIKIKDNRQRRNFAPTELNELADSIKSRGLFHPLTLRTEGTDKVLVAGERRFRALGDIYDLGGSFTHGGEEVPSGHAPYLDLGELDPLAAEEAELEENIRRVDLSWQERAEATARLLKLRTGQAVVQALPLPSIAEISKEVRDSAAGVHHETTRRETIVAKYLADPEVAAAPTLDAAYKVLKRKEETAKRVELAAEIGKTFTAEEHKALNENSLLWFLNSEAEVFDVILTDPPYGMGADTFGDSGGMAAGAHQYDDSYENWKDIMAVFAAGSFKVAKPRAHCYVFCDIDRFHELRGLMKGVGWLPFRTPFIWHKPSGSRAPWPEYGPQRKYEVLLYAVKGNRPCTKLYPDVLSYPSDSNLGHNAQKPVALFMDLLRRSVNPGDRVLDPFCGSGTIFPAAHALKCRAVGIEQDPASYGIALKRLEGLKAAPELEGLM